MTRKITYARKHGHIYMVQSITEPATFYSRTEFEELESGNGGAALWGWIDAMIREAQEQDTEQKAACIHGVNSFTNHGHVNLMVLAVGDPEQAMKIIRQMLDQTQKGSDQ